MIALFVGHFRRCNKTLAELLMIDGTLTNLIRAPPPYYRHAAFDGRLLVTVPG